MAELNHFAISAGLGSILGPKVKVHHGQIGSSELAMTLSQLVRRRAGFIEELRPHENLTGQYENAVRSAFKLVRDGYSSDRILADPKMDREFIKACRDMGVDDSIFNLNMALVGLRKHKKLQVGKSRRASVPDQWKYAIASEIAARVMRYQYGASVDTTLSHPELAKKFDALAMEITPGFTSFQYRWAALNMRKKGAGIEIDEDDLHELQWSGRLRFDSVSRLPVDKGVYTLTEGDTCLFVAGTENIQEGIISHQRIAEVQLFPPDLWRPNPRRLFWQYARMHNSLATYRWGVVRSFVGRWEPIFNIPRGIDEENEGAEQLIS